MNESNFHMKHQNSQPSESPDQFFQTHLRVADTNYFSFNNRRHAINCATPNTLPTRTSKIEPQPQLDREKKIRRHLAGNNWSTLAPTMRSDKAHVQGEQFDGPPSGSHGFYWIKIVELNQAVCPPTPVVCRRRGGVVFLTRFLQIGAVLCFGRFWKVWVFDGISIFLMKK